MKTETIIRYLSSINLIKTLYFNFKYFDFKTACKLPVFINYGVKFLSLKGRIILESNATPGLIVFSKRCSLDFNGKVTFGGKARFGPGTHIYVGNNGVLSFGNDFWLTKNVEINCKKEIVFGNNCLLSWNINILDTDFHFIQQDDNIINEDESIILKDNIWIGCEVVILKGTTICSDIIIGAGSLLNKHYNESNCIYAGNPVKVVKKNVSWKH